MKRKLFLLVSLLLVVSLIITGVYFYHDYREKRQITVGYCIMDSQDETLYFRKNTFAGGLYRKGGAAEEYQKISSDSPEDILATDFAILYTLGKDRLVRYGPDSGQRDIIKTPHSDVTFSISITAFDPEDCSPSEAEQSLKFAKPAFEEPILFRCADSGGTELFRYDKETNTLSAWISIAGIAARQVAVKDSDIYMRSIDALYRVNKDTQEVKLLFNPEDLFFERFVITESNQIFLHAGRTLFLLQDDDENDAPIELGIVDTGPYLYDNRIYTVGAGKLHIYAEDGALLGTAPGFDQIFELSMTKDGIYSYHLSQQMDYHTYEELGFGSIFLQ